MSNVLVTNKKMTTVLFLHGYMQNKTIAEKAMSKLFKGKVSDHLDFIIPDGSFDVDGVNKGWWPLHSKELFCKPHSYENVDLAIKTVINEIGSKKIDVVIGFSQGAVLATILLSKNLLNECKLAVLMSGSDIQDEKYLFDEKIKVPSIFLIGEKDTLCLPEHTTKLAIRYDNPLILTHKWGHVIPTNSEIRDTILSQIK